MAASPRSPPSSPSAHFILVCGAQLIPGFGIVLPVPAVRGDRDIRDFPLPHCNPPGCPQPHHHHPQFLEPSQTGHVPSCPGRGCGSQQSRGMGSLERAAHAVPPFSVHPVCWCWPRAEFSIWEDVCVVFWGMEGGAVLQTHPPPELFNDINVFGGLGGLLFPPKHHPPALPPSKPRCLDLLIVELGSSGARLNP